MHALIIRPIARTEIDLASQWYEERESGLGVELITEIDKALQLLVVTPKMHQTCYRNLRRARLKKFPYGLIYRVKRKVVEILACVHDRQDSKNWQSRN